MTHTHPQRTEEEWITHIVDKVKTVEFLHGVPVELPNETKIILRQSIREALHSYTADREREVREAERKRIEEAMAHAHGGGDWRRILIQTLSEDDLHT